MFTSAVGVLSFCFAIRRRRRFCFVRHLLYFATLQYHNTLLLLQINRNSSVLFQDIVRHPHTRLFEVREAFKRPSSLCFRTCSRAYIAFFPPPAALPGGPPEGPAGGCAAGVLRATRLASPVALRATDAGPLDLRR